MAGLSDIQGYRIEEELGRGGYGQIYVVRDWSTDEIYALKMEPVESEKRGAAHEIAIINSLPREQFLPCIIAHGKTKAAIYMVMPLYGPSLSQIAKQMNQWRFSMSTVAKIGVKLLTVLETLHNAGIVHCDVKPGNILLNKHTIGDFVLVDFGLSAYWRDPETSEPVANGKESNGFRGTVRYASVNVHRGVEPTRRDDIISWFYSLVECAKGGLPWKDVGDEGHVMLCKETISPEKLCVGLPEQMKVVWLAIKDLEFEDKPDYGMLRSALEKISAVDGWATCDVMYDWEVQPLVIRQITKFHELFERQITTTFEQDERHCCQVS